MGWFIRYNQREVIYKNEKGMFHLLSKHQGDIYHTRVGVFFVWYPNRPLSNISNTRMSVSSDIQTPRSNMSNPRRSVSSDIQTPRSNISNTRRSVSSDIQTPRSNISYTRRSVSSDIHTPAGEVMYLTSSHSLFPTSQSASEFHRDCFSFSSAWTSSSSSNLATST